MSDVKEVHTTFEQLIVAWPVLQRLCDVKLAPKIRYHISKLRNLVKSELTEFEAANDKLVQEYGESRSATPEETFRLGDRPMFEVPPYVDNGNGLMVTNPKLATFVAEVKKLKAVEITIPWGPIQSEWIEAVDLSTNEDDALGVLVTRNDS